jgi:very-short-patch-repair endonuclease
MLLSNRTHEIYGYHINDIGKFSQKLIIMKCDFCLKEFSRHKNQMKKPSRVSFPHACQSCDQIKSNWRKNNINNLTPTEFFRLYPKKECLFINEQETLKQFGYTSNDIGPKSEKSVIAVCDFCNNNYRTSLQSVKRNTKVTACKSCSSIASTYCRTNSIQNKYEFYRSMRPEIDFSRIDINKTIEQFGYDPRNLSPMSENKIVTKCYYCNEQISNRFCYFTKQKFKVTCKKCQHKKTTETLITKYGVTSTLDIPGSREKRSDPSTERLVESILINRYKVEFKRNFVIGLYSFDFFIPSINLLIECQGDFFHKFKEFGYQGTPRDNAKSTYVEKYTDYKLVWVWEHELHIGRIQKILDYHIYRALEPIVEVELKRLSFDPILNQQAQAFLSIYHYLGNLGTAATPFGAFHENELVIVCVFGGVTRSSSLGKINTYLGGSYKPLELRELRRFCIKPNSIAENLASYSLARFLKLYKEYKPETKLILSFSDPTVDDYGGIYKASNWQSLPQSSKSYHYLDPSNNRFIHKKTVYEQAISAHMKERQFVESTGLVKIEEMPKKPWLYTYR